MKTQLLSKYSWKSSRETLGVREPQVENPCSIRSARRQLSVTVARRFVYSEFWLFETRMWYTGLSMERCFQSHPMEFPRK